MMGLKCDMRTAGNCYDTWPALRGQWPAPGLATIALGIVRELLGDGQEHNVKGPQNLGSLGGLPSPAARVHLPMGIGAQ